MIIKNYYLTRLLIFIDVCMLIIQSYNNDDGLWILSCEDAIQLSYEMSVVLLMCLK